MLIACILSILPTDIAASTWERETTEVMACWDSTNYITALFPQAQEPPPATQSFCLCWKKFNDLRNVHNFTAL